MNGVTGLKALFIVFVLLMFGLPVTYAQESESNNNIPETNMLPPPASTGKIFAVFDWGPTSSWLTRIVNQTNRSNFVFRDFLVGMYFDTELRNIKYIYPSIRVAAYYPMISSFNMMTQKPKNPLHGGIDLVAGLKFQLLDVQYARFFAGPGLHLFFLNSDRWNYLNLGGAASLSIELPLSLKWVMLFEGIASLDGGNLGSNRRMEPFDIVYQYQVDIGFRYSKKKLHNEKGLFMKHNNVEHN